MIFLGVIDRNASMALRMACLTYGAISSPKVKQGCGAPKYQLSKSVLESYLEEGFMIKDVASLLSVSESTLYRNMGQYGLSKLNVSGIGDEGIGSGS